MSSDVTDKPPRHPWSKIVISLGAVFLLIIHLIFPELPVDAIT